MGFLHLPPDWKVFLRPEKFSKRPSFGGGSVRFFSSPKINNEHEQLSPVYFCHSQGEKPPKIRKKKFPGTKFLGTFGPPPTEKTEKIGKSKGTLVRKVPGNLRSQEFVFFSWAAFLPPSHERLFFKYLQCWEVLPFLPFSASGA